MEEHLEPDVQRQETPESDVGNDVSKTKYDVKAATQQTSVKSKLAILEREVDRDDATHEDILE